MNATYCTAVVGGQRNKRHYTVITMMMCSDKESEALSETSEIETDERDYEPVFTDNFRIFTSRLTNESVFESY